MTHTTPDGDYDEPDAGYPQPTSAELRWRHAAGAWSLLYRSLDANATEGAYALTLAAERLRNAGLADLAEAAEELADDFGTPDEAVRELMERVTAVAARLEWEARS